MNKIITAGCVALAATAALAMPNKQELAKAKPLVEDVAKADLAAYKAGEKTAQKVAAAHIAYAQKAEGEAAKYLLLQGAFKLYARSGEYDLAADAIQIMKRDVKDIPPEVITEIIGDELRHVSDDKAPRLVAMLKEVKSKDAAPVHRDRPRTVEDNAAAARPKRMERDTAKSGVAYHAKTREQVCKDVAQLFPGWSLDTEVQHLNSESADSGLHASHRGQNNVICLHPVGEGKSAILSRCVTLSGKNPCLFLKVASAGIEDGDFLLSVRVNGKDALSNRRICTPDESPWEDFAVSLSAWRGKNVKIEVLLTANGWWYEFPYLARLEVGEAYDGDWGYEIVNDTVVLGNGGRTAVPAMTKGVVIIPAAMGGRSVRGIGNSAFLGCKGLTFVSIPESVTNIAADAFRFCEGLKSINIPSGVRHLNDCMFDACIHLDTITIPEGLESIGAQVFYNCWGLKSVTIPSKVRCVGKVVFSHCRGLNSVIIGSGVKGIGEYAFQHCHSLTAVTMLGERPNAPENIFSECPKLTEIHVPANAKSWAGMTEWQGKKLIFDAEVGK